MSTDNVIPLRDEPPREAYRGAHCRRLKGHSGNHGNTQHEWTT